MFQPTDAGKYFTCNIKGTEVDGRLQYQDGQYYLCQNSKRGDECNDKLGYTYSWCIHTGEDMFLRFEGITNFTFGKRIHFSKSFKDFISKSRDKSKISLMIHKSLHITGEVINYITNRRGGISYMPSDKQQLFNQDGEWKKEGRQEGKPSKTIRKLFTKEGLAELVDKDFEIFANLYKSMNEYDGDFRIVKGDEIVKWYHHSSYASGCGTLNASCMREAPYYWFDIYTKNPKHCSMLILVDKAEKLVGRALLWDLGDKKIMDRIYGADHTIEKFKMWAEDNDVYHKRRQTYENKTEFVKDGEIMELQLKIELENAAFTNYPYMDTFSYLRRSTKDLRNYTPSWEFGSTQVTHGLIYEGEPYDGPVYTEEGRQPLRMCQISRTYLTEDQGVTTTNGLFVARRYATTCNHAGETILLADSITCDWSGLVYHVHQTVSCINGERVYRNHPNLYETYDGYCHIEDTVIDAYDNVRICTHKAAFLNNEHGVRVYVSNRNRVAYAAQVKERLIQLKSEEDARRPVTN